MPTSKQHSEHKGKSNHQSKNKNSFTSKWVEVENARDDMKKMFGFMPTFFNSITDNTLPGAWSEAKELRFGTSTALDTKIKGLIGLAVSSQIPCDNMGYFEQKATLADGAILQEQLEAVLMAAMTRQWSTVLNGLQLDKGEFRKEVDQVMAHVKQMMANSRVNVPPQDTFLVKPTTAYETYKDIEKTLGLVPKFFLFFPKEGISGAWSEFKALQLNPYTALSGKQKELIGLAVAAQIPCDYCIYFHRNAAILNEVSDREMQESVSIAALSRHWSALFHGPQIDPAVFRKEADKMIMNVGPQRLQS